MLHPGETPRVPYVARCLKDVPGVFVAASDYMKVLPESIAQWVPRPLVALGTDGFGRSENRASLRDFFEVDAKHIVLATLHALAREKQIEIQKVEQAVKEGEKVKVGQVVFTVENGTGAKAKAKPKVAESKAKPAQPKTPEQKPAEAPQPQVERRKTPPPSPPATEFRLPELGENIEQGDLVRLMISPGAKVSEGQPIMELETDKAVVEVPSSVTGVVKEVRVKQGEKVKVGQVIFTLEGGALPQPEPVKYAPVEHVSGQHGARLAFQAAIKAEGKTEEQALPVDQPRLTTPDFTMPAQLGKVAGTEYRQPVPAAPHVRRLPRELGLDIQAVKGTGPGGRINDDDVKAHSKALLTSVSEAAQAPRTHVVEPELPDFSKWGKVERVSMRGVRRKTAEHLWEAWSAIAHVTQHDKADITELEQLRARLPPKD